jgi:signal transduction histidine kinase
MRHRLLQANAQTNQILIRSVIYLLALVSSVRGIIVYNEVWLELLFVLIPLAVIYTTEHYIHEQTGMIRLVFTLLQPLMMTVLFIIAPHADFWALMLLPTCYAIPRLFDKRNSTALIAILILGMMICLWFTEEGVSSILFSSVYVVAYIMVWSFSHLILALERARTNAESLSEELTIANRQLQDYAEQVAANTIHEERTAVARELHDSVTQTLFSINLMLSTVSLKHTLDNEALEQELQKIQSLSESAMKELRAIIHQLKPANNVSLSFEKQIQSLIADLKHQHNLLVNVQGTPFSVPNYARNHTFKIIKEALFNIIKHANVKTANIGFDAQMHQSTVSILDTGIGFDSSTPSLPGHMGLETMRMSSQEINATLRLTSKHDEGTKITLIIPHEDIRQVTA